MDISKFLLTEFATTNAPSWLQAGTSCVLVKEEREALISRSWRQDSQGAFGSVDLVRYDGDVGRIETWHLDKSGRGVDGSICLAPVSHRGLKSLFNEHPAQNYTWWKGPMVVGPQSQDWLCDHANEVRSCTCGPTCSCKRSMCAPTREQKPTTFEEAWAIQEKAGFQYGPAALEQVRFGWKLAKQFDGGPPAIEPQKIILDVAKHFSKFPAGRYRSDGPTSGQAFLEDILLPALLKSPTQPVEVFLDGTLGYGSSWLQAAFTGLGHHRVTIVSNDTSLVEEIDAYLRGY